MVCTSVKLVLISQSSASQYLNASGAWSSPDVSTSSTLVLSCISVGKVLIRFSQFSHINKRGFFCHGLLGSFCGVNNSLIVFHHAIRALFADSIYNHSFANSCASEVSSDSDFLLTAAGSHHNRLNFSSSVVSAFICIPRLRYVNHVLYSSLYTM